jgi:multifunctional beta-oxidation protein
VGNQYGVQGQQNPSSGQNQHLDAIQKALATEGRGTEFTYTERDVMLYNLGIGAKRSDLKYVL